MLSRRSQRVSAVSFVQGRGPPQTPRTRLDEQVLLDVTWEAGRSQQVWFRHHASGQGRDAFVAVGKQWTLKCHLLGAKTESTNKTEWDEYRNNEMFADLLPTTYGYGLIRVPPKGRCLEWLLMDRVQFTLAELLSRVSKKPLTKNAMALVVECELAVVTTMWRKASGGLHCHDWHLGNVAFVPEDDTRMVLIDWEGNTTSQELQARTPAARCRNCFRSFTRHSCPPSPLSPPTPPRLYLAFHPLSPGGSFS